MRSSPQQRAALFAAVVSGLALAVALSSETWAGLVPCALCLLERWPYRVMLGLGAVAWLWPRAGTALAGLGVLTMLAGVALGATHVGVEEGAWPSPLPECAAPQLGQGTMAGRLARMPARPAKPCDEPAYLVPNVPVSMAEMNLGLSALLGAGLVYSIRRRTP